MTYDVTTSAEAAPGYSLSFVDEPAFHLLQRAYQAPTPTLEIAGTVTDAFHSGVGYAAGIRVDYGGGYDGATSVTIDGSGLLRVQSLAPDAPVVGIAASGPGPIVLNNGRIEVTGPGQLTGVSGELRFVNHGVLHVASDAAATGVYGGFHPNLSNNGVIDVTGTSATGVTLLRTDSDFTNTGTITATSTSAATPSTAVLLFPELSQDHHWLNTGTIRGDVALQVNAAAWPWHMDFTNQGLMSGTVAFGGSANAQFTNSGTIQGILSFGSGDDVYLGRTGQVTGPVDGGDGADLLQGGDDGETLSGGTGDDTISGGRGDDLISGNTGSDHLDGGGGVNTVSYADVRVSGVSLDLSANIETDNGTSDTLANFQRVVGSNFADTLTGSAGSDTLLGGIGADRVFGGAGDDVIDGGSGFNYLRGDDGDDSVQGGAAFDDINGNKGDDTIDGGAGGDDWLVGGQGNDLITAHTGGNILYGNIGNDTLNGGSGAEILRGGQNDDIVFGGAGDDWISGDRGDDTLTGGAGADIFHTFNGAGLDRVTDFNAAEGDRVQLDPGTTYNVTQVGADTVIDLGGGDRMVLAGVQSSNLPPGWIFGA